MRCGDLGTGIRKTFLKLQCKRILNQLRFTVGRRKGKDDSDLE
jgi:hypothetical protein